MESNPQQPGATLQYSRHSNGVSCHKTHMHCLLHGSLDLSTMFDHSRLDYAQMHTQNTHKHTRTQAQPHKRSHTRAATPTPRTHAHTHTNSRIHTRTVTHTHVQIAIHVAKFGAKACATQPLQNYLMDCSPRARLHTTSTARAERSHKRTGRHCCSASAPPYLSR